MEFSSPQNFEVALIALANWQVREDGRIELWQKSEHLIVEIDTNATYTVENDKVEEEWLSFTRLAIRLTGPQSKVSFV